jgi:predicted GH43/DUF377 family glycosyl hydrolase
MAPPPLTVTRLDRKFVSDDRRIIARLFDPGGEARIRAVVDRVMAMREEDVEAVLARTLRRYNARHGDVGEIFEDHFNELTKEFEPPPGLSRERRLLIGAYFTMEYSVESAALFNPSIVPHPNQEGVPGGSLRFVMSLRATGEGHLSSIVFRTGVIEGGGGIRFDVPSRYMHRLKPVRDRQIEKKWLFRKLIEIGAYNDAAQAVLDRLPEEFPYQELDRAVEAVRHTAGTTEMYEEAATNICWVARSNYLLEYEPGTDPSSVVIFPATENESRGIEDARLVRFVDDDEEVRYYATYTAYNGFRILPQLMETPDFGTIRVRTLHGKYAQNKGFALFPRKLDGWYLMLARLDGENNYLMKSRDIAFWNDAVLLQAPEYPWEFVQIGNCGSPLETEAGWLLLTHGVGPMREYCIGASLLDLEDPSRVLGHLAEPLIVPIDEEREGYVPNVVYSCGALIHAGRLIIPYAMADSATSFASVPVDDLLAHLSAE